jgi:rhodanese-related sulfurtransferase
LSSWIAAAAGPFGCGSRPAGQYRGGVPIAEITVEELAARLQDGAIVVDVREVHEWVQVRVPGVRLIPLGELPQRAREIPEADVVYVICRSGARSLRACEVLMRTGAEAVNVAGGTLAWVDSGRPTESGPG